MIVFPKAKINLGLNILNLRTDGYHNLSTIFYTIGLQDVMEINPSGKISISFSGLPIKGDDSSNLCLKAFDLFKRDFNIAPISMHLHKVIPMGAGLGGGSSDGTATLLAMNEIYNLNISKQALVNYALELGSDCPFFVDDSPSYATGRGEELKSIDVDLTAYKFVLVCPQIHISTAEAFGNLNSDRNQLSITKELDEPVSKWKYFLTNDFEAGAFLSHPRLKEIKAELYNQGAVYASMTGTGSAIFGLFSQDAEIDVSRFKSDYVWVEG